MVKRIILWKIKDDQNKQANLNLLREGLLALATKVGDIVSVEVGLNFSSADYDIIFIVAFADPFQLKQFQTNPEYLKIFQQAQGISTNMIFCDYMAETSTTVSNGNMSHAPKGLIGNTGALPKGLLGSNTNALPNLNNPSNQQMNNLGGNGMFGSTPKPNSLDGTKPFSPINNNALPFAGREYNNQQNPQPQGNNFNGFNNNQGGGFNNNPNNGFNNNQNNNFNNQYNGFGSNSDNKNGGVNFTVSENVNMRFANDKQEQMNTNESSWKCSKCGKTNSSFISMCSCGRKKPVDNMPMGGRMPMGNNMPMGGGMQPPNNPQGGNPNSMLLNSSLLPKIPSMPKSNIPNSNGAWLCPSCGKSNNEFMKVCICGHRKVERGGGANNSPNDFNNSGPSPMGFNNPNINNMPKTPAMGANNIKSPNNNEFFNSFGGGSNKPGGPMNNPNGPMNKPGGPMNGHTSPINGLGGPMNGPNGPMNKPGGPMNGPSGPMNKPGGPMNGPNGPMNKPGGPMNGHNGPMNGPSPRMPQPNMSRVPLGATGPITPPNKNMGGGLSPNNLPPDSWKCPRCGKVLGNFVGQCVCGQRKPTRPMGGGPNMGPMGPAGPGPNNSHMRF